MYTPPSMREGLPYQFPRLSVDPGLEMSIVPAQMLVTSILQCHVKYIKKFSIEDGKALNYLPANVHVL